MNSRSFGHDSVDPLNRIDDGTDGFAREDYVHDKNGNLLRVERRVNVGDASRRRATCMQCCTMGSISVSG